MQDHVPRWRRRFRIVVDVETEVFDLRTAKALRQQPQILGKAPCDFQPCQQGLEAHLERQQRLLELAIRTPEVVNQRAMRQALLAAEGEIDQEETGFPDLWASDEELLGPLIGQMEAEDRDFFKPHMCGEQLYHWTSDFHRAFFARVIRADISPVEDDAGVDG